MAEKQKYKAMYKYELADAAGVSIKTFREWIRNDVADLKKYGYTISDKLLSPGAVKFLCEKYCIVLE